MVLSQLGKIKDQHRLSIQAQSCLEHRSNLLESTICPTLIIDAADDQVIGLDTSCELEQTIPKSCLEILEDCGHALYEKNKEFNQLLLGFLAE